MKVVNRIKKTNDFALIIKEGRVSKTKEFTIHYLPNTLNYTRIGISVSSKLGNAVLRNRIKRQVRAMCDELIKYETLALDLVIIVRHPFLKKDYHSNKEVLGDIISTIER
mgnify:CR=1 FL=1